MQRFTMDGEQTTSALAGVLKRYGLNRPGLDKNTSAKLNSVSKQSEQLNLKEQPSSDAELPFVVDWIQWPDMPAEKPTGSPTQQEGVQGDLTELPVPEFHDFYFVIRVAESTVPLLCQVSAASIAAAKQRVQGIRNLTEWRMISRAELAELLKVEGIPSDWL